MSARSHLYVPADAPDKLTKALTRGADRVIADLEDAVAPDRKEAARRSLQQWLAQLTTPVWVRVNAGDVLEADLDVLADGVRRGCLEGICLPKAEDPADLHRIAGWLDGLEREHLRPPVALAPIVESAAGLAAAVSLARAPRVTRLQLGEADLSAELGIEASADELELAHLRGAVVLASAQAGIGPPVGPASTDFTDLDRLRATTLRLRRFGFAGRTCVHPRQVAIVNEVFTPSAEQVDRARRMLAGFTAAGSGAFADEHGRMVDAAVVRAARRILETAEQGQPR